MFRHRNAVLVATLLFTILALEAVVSFAVTPPVPNGPNWKKVREAMNQGLPKTAIKKLEPLIAKALADKNHDAAVRGIATQVMLEASIQGNQPSERVIRMESEIAKAPEEIKPVLEAILAHWYWSYFQQNRWRFANRTSMESPSVNESDFTTWDLTRILSEIDQHFKTALKAAPALKTIAASDYDEFLEKGNAGDAYRPTLYDVIAESALSFYTAGEHGTSKSQNAFDLQTSSPVFDSRDRFLDWQPDRDDTFSPLLSAVKLYQDLIRFHVDDTDTTALLDWDLARYRFGLNYAVGQSEDGETREKLYQNAMRRFASDYKDHSTSARALHELANQLHSEQKSAEAHALATEGLNRFPESVGGRRCYNLIQQIESKSANIHAERVWSDPLPSIDVTYRNVDRVYFRLIEYDYVEYMQSKRYRPDQGSQADLNRWIAQTPTRSWSADLPKTDDFLQRTESIDTPDDVPLGSYLLLASHEEDFSDEDNQVSVTEIWRSNLAIVTRTHHDGDPVDGLVLDSKSGNPVKNAKVQIWQRQERNQRLSLLDTVQTGAEGRFKTKSTERRGFRLLVTHQDDRLGSMQEFHNQRRSKRLVVDHSHTIFFTDRSIYRPGQSIQYKGVCYWANQDDNDYRTLAGQNVSVVFADANGQEIETRTHRCNDYGSFSGSVTAPRDRLMGQMYLRVGSGPNGQAAIRVEEYKRPKFRVEVQSPDKPAKLGDAIAVNGKATAYTGVPIDGAKVAYRVVRQVRYAPWWYWRCWWMPVSNQPNQEIANGTTTTDDQGNFQVEFVARPDESVVKESEPTFTFKVYADVTDTTGETRSDQTSIPLRYSAISATMSAKDFLTTEKATELAVRVSGLFGDDQKATGTIKVHRLKQPEKVVRAKLQGHRVYGRASGGQARQADLTNPDSWELDDVVAELPFETTPSGQATVSATLDAGIYRAVLMTSDGNGNSATAYERLQVLDPVAEDFDIKIPFVLSASSFTVEPGQTFKAIWGSGYDSARVFIEVIHRNEVLQAFWTDVDQTQGTIEVPIDESMRGGLSLRTTMVRENRIYQNNRQINVPWTNKSLDITWERFVSKLQPAAEETWTAIIKGPSGDGEKDAEAAIAEMVATLYDASLDAFTPHSFRGLSSVFRRNYDYVSASFENQMKHFSVMRNSWRTDSRDGSLTYWRLPSELIRQQWGPRGGFGGDVMAYGAAVPRSAPMTMMKSARSHTVAEESEGIAMEAQADSGLLSTTTASASGGERSDKSGDQPDLENVSARKNLQETAFFFPQLVSDADGTIRMSFTMPEALTEWKFIGLAHDQQLRSGMLTGTTVTAKDLMVQPNPPRFVREGDQIEFTVKVSNQSPTIQNGTVRLTFADARTGDSVDDRLGNSTSDKTFSIPAGQSKSFSWRIDVADGLGFLTYKAVGSTGRLSDGEEGYLPVLSRRVLVQESLPLPIRGNQTKQFDFAKLIASADSDSIQHQSLTVQMVSNPSWYAVMALPYLMEFPHECSEQTFNRFYANTLARHIVGSDAKIESVFDQWRATPALDSPLEKNEELKSVMIQETPWQRQAKAESQARRDVGILFEENRLDSEMKRALDKLTQMQLADGSWPWFNGGNGNSYLTLYITTGFGRLRHLGVDVDASVAVKSLTFLDQWSHQMYERIKVKDRGKNHLTSTVALYLYGRSFFLKDQPIADQHREALNYWLGQADKHWLDLNVRQSQAQLAVALKRFGNVAKSKAIMKSVKERSVSDEELGMFWRDTEASWWWYRAPIETQAMMIEAFDEVMNDQDSVESCKVWLLKQKQTQAWKTTKATADAVYSLLLRGSDLLASDALVEVTLGGNVVEPKNVEAGTGFYQERFAGESVKSTMGQVTVKKVDDGVAWGSLHWQYLEDISKVTPHDGTPLKLTKQLYVKKNTDAGPKLVRVEGAIGVGDELVVRIVLRSDRDMEFVHLKDHRGSGTEPVNVLSRYKSQDGIRYYESTRDTASHFFIDYLPKGNYVFEYSTRVQLKGEYQTGFAHIECMYAPEFDAHSESLPISVP